MKPSYSFDKNKLEYTILITAFNYESISHLVFYEIKAFLINYGNKEYVNCY